MNNWEVAKNKHAFTLIELIMVIGVIVILLAGLFVAVDPAKRIGEARDAQRWQDLRAIAEAVETYVADNADLPSDFSTTTIGMGDKAILCSSESSLDCNGQTKGCLVVDDTDFWGTYINEIPIDPSSSDTTDSGYYLTRLDGDTLALGVCDPYTSDGIVVKSKVTLPNLSISCDGWYYAGYCWYMGGFTNEDCDSVCSTHGGCIDDNWDDDTNCAVGYHFSPDSSSCTEAAEGQTWAPYKSGSSPTSGLLYRNSGTSQSCGGSAGGNARLCACND